MSAGGSPIGAYRLEMCCQGSTEGARGDGGKGKGKMDPPFELAYLGPDRTAGGWPVHWLNLLQLTAHESNAAPSGGCR